MIHSLEIQNYAIIDHVNIDFDKDLNIITGETGAGKSIILGALGLIMGNRADSKVLYDKSKKCIVEAEFHDYPEQINHILTEEDYDIEDVLLVRREIISSGKSRAFINDTPAKLDLLQRLSHALIDLNQQFQIADIQKSDFQINAIDALADHADTLDAYKQIYSEYKKKSRQLHELENMAATQVKELEFMQYQLDELDKASLLPSEQTQLESESDLLSKTETIQQLMQETRFVLADGESNIKDIILDLTHKWSSLSGINQELSNGYDQLVALQDVIAQVFDSAENIESSIDNDPVRLNEVQSRLDTIYSLQQKHQVNSVDQLISISDALREKVASLGDRTGSIAKLTTEIAALDQKLEKLSNKISKKRAKVIPQLQKAVTKKLVELSMPSAELKVEHTPSSEYKADGRDDIHFLFKANKGSDYNPIKKVASGGEKSRLMLALKATIADNMALPTMIFDEIDTGVSGAVANTMGGILKSLSGSHQLICITHSPQVSSKASKHFFVHKQETKNRTLTQVKVLQGEDRIVEIAKMLSGNPPTTFALKNAKELIEL